VTNLPRATHQNTAGLVSTSVTSMIRFSSGNSGTVLFFPSRNYVLQFANENKINLISHLIQPSHCRVVDTRVI